MRFGIVIDTSKCMACYNCFMACKDEHCGHSTEVSAPQPHKNHPWIKVYDHERGDDTRRIKTAAVPMPCSHCQDPACMKAATNNAVYKRPDGIVIIDPVKAKGQKQIVTACPIGAVNWNDELQLPQKCTMCAHLLDEGWKEPRCVEACPNQAMYFGDLDDTHSEINAIIRRGKVTQLQPLVNMETQVVHLNIPTVFLAGSVYLPGNETGEEPADRASITLTCENTGEKLLGETNYFGDWEFEWLTKWADYNITIKLPGYKTASLSARADTDHYLGEVILEAE